MKTLASIKIIASVHGTGVTEVQTRGSLYNEPSIAYVREIDRIGRIHGSIHDTKTATWWYPNGRNCCFRDFDLSSEVVEALKLIHLKVQ